MKLKLRTVFLTLFLVALVALAGCERTQDALMDNMQPTGPTVEPVPVKLVWLIDYPENGKDAYLAWVASNAPTLQAPEEVTRIRSYDNQDQTMSPNRLVEFEFGSFIDAATYLNRPEIAAILEDLPNHSSKSSVYTFIERSDYAKTEAGNFPIKTVYLIDYPLGGKAAYLEWVASISSELTAPPQLKAVASYDNYYGESPHRLVQFEYASQEDSETYAALEEIQAIDAALDVRAGSWESHRFVLRGDYVNE